MRASGVTAAEQQRAAATTASGTPSGRGGGRAERVGGPRAAGRPWRAGYPAAGREGQNAGRIADWWHGPGRPAAAEACRLPGGLAVAPGAAGRLGRRPAGRGGRGHRPGRRRDHPGAADPAGQTGTARLRRPAQPPAVPAHAVLPGRARASGAGRPGQGRGGHAEYRGPRGGRADGHTGGLGPPGRTPCGHGQGTREPRPARPGPSRARREVPVHRPAGPLPGAPHPVRLQRPGLQRQRHQPRRNRLPRHPRAGPQPGPHQPGHGPSHRDPARRGRRARGGRGGAGRLDGLRHAPAAHPAPAPGRSHRRGPPPAQRTRTQRTRGWRTRG